MKLTITLDTDKLISKLSQFGLTVEGMEAKKRKVTAKFVKPTVEQIRDYAKEIKFEVDAQACWDYYESCGWKVGNKPMKCWQAMLRGWKQRRGNNDSKEEKKFVDPKIEFNRVLNEIILGWQNTPENSRDRYLDGLFDKWGDIPKYQNWHVVNLAKKRISEM